MNLGRQLSFGVMGEYKYKIIKGTEEKNKGNMVVLVASAIK
jgi:hypothetical protein